MEEDRRLLEESLRLIYDIDGRLKDYYLKGELDLTKYQSYKLGVDYLFLSYDRIMELNSSCLKSFSNFLYKKKYSELDMNKDYLIELINISNNVRERNFQKLDKILNKTSHMSFKVKCYRCRKKEIYKGQGIIIKNQREVELGEEAIGKWFCSENCYRA